MVMAKVATGQAATIDPITSGVAGLIYKVYPNPVSKMAFVNLTSPENAHVVEVCNSIENPRVF
jgi:hypothetical protein